MLYKPGICYTGYGYVLQVLDMLYRYGLCYIALGYVLQAPDVIQACNVIQAYYILNSHGKCHTDMA